MIQRSPRFRAIEGFPGYAVSDHGEVLSFKYGRFHLRKLGKGVGGYPYLGLCLGRKTVTKKVHSLVAETFLGKKPSIDHEVCHNDGNPDNNLLENLRWGTAKENAQDRIRHGRNNSPVGTKCHNAKLTDEIVLEIRRSKMTNRYLGEKYGVPNSTIFCVKNFKTWRHVK